MLPSESREFLREILEGKLPSIVFNMVLESTPGLDKYTLADVFLEEYSRLDSKILPVIWNWKSVNSIRGMSDQEFDEAVLLHMRLAGYIV